MNVDCSIRVIQNGDCSRVYRSISLTCKLTSDFQYTENKPIMLALCLMLSGTYYAKNYAGIIGRGLANFDPLEIYQ